MEASDKAIMKSLKRSKVRVIILLYMAQSYNRQVNLKELCKNLNLCAANVLGALIGSECRYKYKDSLVGMELLERIETNIEDLKLIHYRLTKKGADIISMLEKEPMTGYQIEIRLHKV